MNLDQYNALVAALPLIEVALAEKKVQAARPDYEADSGGAKITKDGGAEDGEEADKVAVDADNDEEEQ